MSKALVLNMGDDWNSDTYSPFTGFCMLISMDSWAMDTEQVIGRWLDWEKRDEEKDIELFGKDALDSIVRIREELKNLRRALRDDAFPRMGEGRVIETEWYGLEEQTQS